MSVTFQTGPSHFLQRLNFASPLLMRSSMIFAFMFALTFGLTSIDPRLFNGVSVWEKPAKFFLSIALHMATLAWGVSLLDLAQRQSRLIRFGSLTFVCASVFEVAYISYQAAQVAASHYNSSSAFAIIMYALMGLGATSMVVVTGLFGWRLLRSRRDIMGFAAGWGFMLASVCTMLVAGYLSSLGSH